MWYNLIKETEMGGGKQMNLAGWIGFVFIVINLIGFIIFVLPYFKDK